VLFIFALMKDYYKIRVIVGYTMICLWLFMKFCFFYFQIYFISESIEEYFDLISLIFLAFGGVFLMTYGIWKKSKIRVSINFILVLIVILFIRFFISSSFSGLCVETKGDWVYINEEDNRILYNTDYNCGAWDSDPPNTDYFERIKINRFIYQKKIYPLEELNLKYWKQESNKLHEWKIK